MSYSHSTCPGRENGAVIRAQTEINQLQSGIFHGVPDVWTGDDFAIRG